MKSICRFSLLLIAVWAANIAIAGNLDVESHCVPKRVVETVKKALDGGANETKEHSHTAHASMSPRRLKELEPVELRI